MRRNLSAYTNTTIVAGGVWDKPAALSIRDRNVMPWAYQVAETRRARMASRPSPSPTSPPGGGS
jgi:hypothetical protein